ncbi:hypothetical protein LCGC14_0246470 [marine sediment metagenome]|uniref:Uncharacterized protein n=1 Tax=marine sediment metagenome TaxID=412755 RepID=A0A0F9WR85_9ZZZZ
MRKYIVTLLVVLILLLQGCNSYKYVPTKERAAKKALQREVEKITAKQNRVRSIVLAYPHLVDTVTTTVKVDVVSEIKTDTVKIIVQDTARVDSLYTVVDQLLIDLLNIPESDTITIEKIRWLLGEAKEESVIRDTLISFIITRKLNIGEVKLSLSTDISLGILGGELIHSYKILPIDTKIALEIDKQVTFDVRRVPRVLRLAGGTVGIVIVIILIVLGIRILKPIIKKLL